MGRDSQRLHAAPFCSGRSRCPPYVITVIEIRPAVINNKRLHFAIISRRSRHRVGTRYFSRGIDHAGRVSNYVETEQVLECESGDLYSYVQTRGSIPVFWRQVVNLKYSPRLVVDPNPDTERAIRRHFESETQHYGRQIAVNLVNKKGSEERVGDAYTRLLKGLDDLGIAYNWFDFHHECRNMKWHRISILLDQLENELNEQGWVGCVARLPTRWLTAPRSFLDTRISTLPDALFRSNRRLCEQTAWTAWIGPTFSNPSSVDVRSPCSCGKQATYPPKNAPMNTTLLNSSTKICGLITRTRLVRSIREPERSRPISRGRGGGRRGGC